MTDKKKIYVYVDGFNLFYGSLKKSPYKWLDIEKLCQAYFPKYEIAKIKYFSAITKARKDDLNKPVRQQIYFRALRTIPCLEIILGSFQENHSRNPIVSHYKNKRQSIIVEFLKSLNMKLPLADDNKRKKHQFVWIKKTEEKGSDVNLGAHLVSDAYEKKFDIGVVVSNDSDLAEPIRIVNNKLKIPVGLLSPYKISNRKLIKATKFQKTIRSGALQNSQFFESLTDKTGNFHKPKDWK